MSLVKKQTCCVCFTFTACSSASYLGHHTQMFHSLGPDIVDRIPHLRPRQSQIFVNIATSCLRSCDVLLSGGFGCIALKLSVALQRLFCGTILVVIVSCYMIMEIVRMVIIHVCLVRDNHRETRHS